MPCMQTIKCEVGVYNLDMQLQLHMKTHEMGFNNLVFFKFTLCDQVGPVGRRAHVFLWGMSYIFSYK